MLKSKFEDFVFFLKNKKVLITTHDLVDIDGLTSVFVLKFFIEQFNNSNGIRCIFPEFSKPTREFVIKLSKRFPKINFTFEKEVNLSEIDIIIILDTNNLDQVKFSNNFNILNSEIPFIFLDHHLNLNKEYKGNITRLNIIDDNFSSSSEIIFELCENFNIELKTHHKYMLIAAILTDSGFFKYANNDTIARVSKLLNNELDYQEIISMLRVDKDLSEKLAIIKALQRVQLIQHGKWIIGITHVGSFEAKVAHSLLNLGFDVGIVYSEKKSEYRVSTRAKKSACKTGLHLGKILEEVSALSKGSAGGHEGAASLNGKVELKNVIDKILKKIKEILKNH
ncbi:MAG: bifunctional oligoribonuclease/PAP phosphatase NrnA [Promethearchaeota archaeon]